MIPPESTAKVTAIYKADNGKFYVELKGSHWQDCHKIKLKEAVFLQIGDEIKVLDYWDEDTGEYVVEIVRPITRIKKRKSKEEVCPS